MGQRIIRIPGSITDREKFCSNRVSTTMYSVSDFLPRFLFKQIGSFTGCFFLFIAILQLIPDAPRSTNWGPLKFFLLILTTHALVDIYQDFVRHKADKITNGKKIEVLRRGPAGTAWKFETWGNLQVDDIVRLHDNVNESFVPADLILLSSSNPQALCYIETSSLDGETDLKIRQGLAITSNYTTSEMLSSLRCTLRCDPPNSCLNEFSGTLQLDETNESFAIGPDQLLWRGARLEQTEWAIGLVVYAGHETKLLKNSAVKAPLKRSTIEVQADALIGVMFAVFLLMSIVFSSFGDIRQENVDMKRSHSDVIVNFYNWIDFVLIFYNFVPARIPILKTAVRFFTTRAITKDPEMYDLESDIPPRVNSSNLNEDLGRVEHVFIDKTGTLTKNEMKLEKCSIGGIVYAVNRYTADPISRVELGQVNAPNIKEFLTLLTVCNTVIPGRNENGLLNYTSSRSPDDKALVEGAARFGWMLQSRTPESITILADGREERFEVLRVFDFTSERKRMSVIVRSPTGKIVLYAKGADTAIFERLGPDQEHVRQATLSQVDAFAKEGLRTLCCAMAEIPPDEYAEWSRMYEEVKHNHTQKLAAVDLIEKNLVLLGATGIEDMLQQEVPETIDALKACVKMWLLTGDKQESAINIGYSSHLLDSSMELVKLNMDNLEDTRMLINKLIADNLPVMDAPSQRIALVIDGRTLSYALNCDLKKAFLQLCLKSSAVICCRVSPSQKAEIVEAVNQETGAVTLAIGDGANDVPMIQKASIGVGISGRDGREASRASDYSIGQFRFLRRLLLVHGAHNYYCMAQLILANQRMNITFHTTTLVIAAQSVSHFQILLDPWFSVYSSIFACALPLFLGLFNKPSKAEDAYERPELYKQSQLLCAKELVLSTGMAVLQSVPVFLLWSSLFRQTLISTDANEADYFILCNAVLTYALVTASLTAAFKAKLGPVFTLVAIVGLVLISTLSLALYSRFWGDVSEESIGASMIEMWRTRSIPPLCAFGFIVIALIVLRLDYVLKLLLNTPLELARPRNEASTHEIVEYEALLV